MSKTFMNIVLLLVLTSILFAQDPFNSGVNFPNATTDPSQAVAFGDYDNDGFIDVYITRGNATNGDNFINYLYKNNGSGSGIPFEKQTISGVTDIDSTSGGASWGDYNNDGYIDLYVANAQDGPSPPFGSSTPKRNNLFKNSSSGLNEEFNAGSLTTDVEDGGTVGWGDYNNDGYLDMFVDNGKVGTFGPAPGANSFYENDGISENFSKKSSSEIGNIVNSTTTDYLTFRSGFAWSDFNNDGFMDIFNPRAGGSANKLWINTGNGTFNEYASTEFEVAQTAFYGASWGDFNNDGKMDLFVSNLMDGTVTRNFVYQNNSTPFSTSFTEITSTQYGPILNDEGQSQGSFWFDYDNDGDLDLYVANRGTDPGEESKLYNNSGYPNYNFSSVNSNIENAGDSHGTAAADIDNDGDLDVVVSRDEAQPLLFKNNGNSNNWANIFCIGTSTNKSAIGTKLELVSIVPQQNGKIKQHREILSQTGIGSQNSLRAHYGLGTGTKIDTIRIKWLNSSGSAKRDTNYYSDLPVNKFYIYTQGNSIVTSNVFGNQTFVYLNGTTGAAVEFTTPDSDGGILNVQRTDSDPGGTFSSNSATNPGGATITANTVYPDKYWTISQTDLTGFITTVYFDGSGLTGSPNLDDVVLLKRDNSSTDWVALNTERIGNTLFSAGVSSFSEFAIGYEEAPQTVLLETKIFLQGAYDSTSDEMRTDIFGSIPTTSPYSEDARTVDPLPANIVDWVLVELRNTDTGPAVVSKSAFLHKDGRIVNDDATSGQIVMEAPPGSYYIVIKHRNHLSVMSSNGVPLNASTSTLYDFTN